MQIMIDTYGLFRATKNVKIINEEYGAEIYKDFQNYRSHYNIHLDMNPWRFLDADYQTECEKELNKLCYIKVESFIGENNHIGSIFHNSGYQNLSEFSEDNINKIARRHIQGLVNFADNLEEDGGFQLVPGFHKNFIKWTKENSEKLQQLYID